ncbi:hypothetical protein [Alteribacter natronophilus]|uniref:hypothetical protein n=1 Tax=Alteribacter natronophilus TaxID=2583810 RepID=UPI00110E5965|nr:hypothetical protein [Alteribacter natronophilus]TMW70010.1 hypothetical protein FGB90_17660 [Alteribacter natronophilus]
MPAESVRLQQNKTTVFPKAAFKKESIKPAADNGYRLMQDGQDNPLKLSSAKVMKTAETGDTERRGAIDSPSFIVIS